MKKCNKCGKIKSITEFHKNSYSKDGHLSICKECRKSNTFKRKKYNHYKLDRSITKSINLTFKKSLKNPIWEKILDFSKEDLKKHLEDNFEEGMSWENYGTYWVIDKIIPTSLYLYSDVKNNEFKKAWSIKNFRPLIKIDHNRKRDKIIYFLIDKYNLFDILPSGLFHFSK